MLGNEDTLLSPREERRMGHNESLRLLITELRNLFAAKERLMLSLHEELVEHIEKLRESQITK
ncbi:MAG TPA: hypothetical protein VI485_04460 [Vicinamibacterales bacterium]|nr:hypothetical protein [Vicinamibacterales bacterium]